MAKVNWPKFYESKKRHWELNRFLPRAFPIYHAGFPVKASPRVVCRISDDIFSVFPFLVLPALGWMASSFIFPPDHLIFLLRNLTHSSHAPCSKLTISWRQSKLPHPFSDPSERLGERSRSSNLSNSSRVWTPMNPLELLNHCNHRTDFQLSGCMCKKDIFKNGDLLPWNSYCSKELVTLLLRICSPLQSTLNNAIYIENISLSGLLIRSGAEVHLTSVLHIPPLSYFYKHLLGALCLPVCRVWASTGRTSKGTFPI